jgi:hypothetical protein
MMLNVTNAAIISLSDVDAGFDDLKSKLDLRGKQINATVEDIIPMQADNEHMMASFQATIAQLLVMYTPGNDKWEGRKDIVEAVKAMM